MPILVAAISAIAALLSVAGILLSQWRWDSCGYDCGIFGVTSGPAAIAVHLGSTATLIAALGFLVVSLAFEWFARRAAGGRGQSSAGR